jgi:hypothetical protein
VLIAIGLLLIAAAPASAGLLRGNATDDVPDLWIGVNPSTGALVNGGLWLVVPNSLKAQGGAVQGYVPSVTMKATADVFNPANSGSGNARNLVWGVIAEWWSAANSGRPIGTQFDYGTVDEPWPGYDPEGAGPPHTLPNVPQAGGGTAITARATGDYPITGSRSQRIGPSTGGAILMPYGTVAEQDALLAALDPTGGGFGVWWWDSRIQQSADEIANSLFTQWEWDRDQVPGVIMPPVGPIGQPPVWNAFDDTNPDLQGGRTEFQRAWWEYRPEFKPALIAASATDPDNDPVTLAVTGVTKVGGGTPINATLANGIVSLDWPIDPSYVGKYTIAMTASAAGDVVPGSFDFTITVPEPSTFVLLGACVLGLLVWWRKK